jgi:hypothetical protein
MNTSEFKFLPKTSYVGKIGGAERKFTVLFMDSTVPHLIVEKGQLLSLLIDDPHVDSNALRNIRSTYNVHRFNLDLSTVREQSNTTPSNDYLIETVNLT